MLEVLEFSGKNLEEALIAASRELDMQPDFIDYEIVTSGKKGLLGLLRKKEVKIRIKHLPDEIKRERAEILTKKNSVGKEKVIPEKTGKETVKPERTKRKTPAPIRIKPQIHKAEEIESSAFDDYAIENLEKILLAMKLDLKIRVKDSNTRHLSLDLIGKDRTVLLAKDGQPLNDLQYVLNLIVMHNFREKKKVQLDSQGFRRRREREVVEIAKRTAEKVILSGKDKKLSPMNPYERRLIHLTLNDNKSVTSFSVGKGFIKRVIVTVSKTKERKKYSAEK